MKILGSVNQTSYQVICISQLFSITHEVNKSFYCKPPVDAIGAFLEISKAFYNVWHEGLILKLQCYGIEGNSLTLLKY